MFQNIIVSLIFPFGLKDAWLLNNQPVSTCSRDILMNTLDSDGLWTKGLGLRLAPMAVRPYTWDMASCRGTTVSWSQKGTQSFWSATWQILHLLIHLITTLWGNIVPGSQLQKQKSKRNTVICLRSQPWWSEFPGLSDTVSLLSLVINKGLLFSQMLYSSLLTLERKSQFLGIFLIFLLKNCWAIFKWLLAC